MIPVKLSIQGLYSYQALQEVAFQELIGASVFGIFGKVGSGKSSLLEAISFVLYGESERLNGRDNRAYNMMNLKSNHLIIDFEFRAGADHQRYKFVYEAKRHPKKHHDIASTERRQFCWEQGEWRPIGLEKDDVAALTTSIVGLDYANFKRTIIIPQNQFREFLELNPKDRTEMMSRLFRLEKYDLASRTAKLEKANDANLNVVKGQLEGLGAASPEAIETAQKAIDAVEAIIREKEVEINTLDIREKQLVQLQQRFLEQAEVADELVTLKAAQPTYQHIRDQVDQYEQCMQWFSVLFSQADDSLKRQEMVAKSLSQSAGLLAKANQQLPALEATYQTALKAFENRDKLQKQINELDLVINIRNNQHSIAQQTQQQNTLQKRIANQVAAIAQLRTERANQQAVVAQNQNPNSQLEQLYTIQQWFAAYRPLQKNVNDINLRIQAYDLALEDIKRRKTDALTNFPVAWNEVPLKNLPATIQAATDDLQQQADQQKTRYDNELLRQKLHQYATALVDGKPCPLCGSLHHPAISHDATIDAEVAASKSAVNVLLKQIKSLNTLLGQAEGLLGEIKTVHGQGKELVNEHTAAVMRQTAHEALFIWPDFTIDDEQLLAAAIQREKTAQQHVQQAQQLISDLNEKIELAERQKAETEAEAIKISTQLEGLSDTVGKQLVKLVYFQPADIDTLTPQQIIDLTDQLNQQYEQTKIDFSEAEQAKSAAEQAQTRHQAEVDTYQKQQNSLQEEYETIEATIAQTLNQHGYTRSEANAVLASAFDVATERQRFRAFEQQLSAVQQRFDALTSELANQPFDVTELQQIRQALGQAQASGKQLHQQLGENRKIYGNLVEQWEKRQAVQQQWDTLVLRQKALGEMMSLFRAQGFVNYVSAVYLKNLCEAANERFAKLTNNHLRLEIDEKNNFLVRDYLNEGKTRLAKTLSGGQLFQASLSLALALSDNIQHLTQSKQNLFFLDEGFGSLDKESLQTVFKTLQALRNENRIVGIISHVEELQLEIETFIRTENTESGSRITKSWE